MGDKMYEQGGNLVTIRRDEQEYVNNIVFTNKNFSTCKSKVNKKSNLSEQDESIPNLASNLLQKQYKK